MEAQDLTLLLLVSVILLIGVSLYAVWLWLNLWFTNRAMGKIAVIQANPGQYEPQTRNGCTGLFLGLMIFAAIGGLLVYANW